MYILLVLYHLNYALIILILIKTSFLSPQTMAKPINTFHMQVIARFTWALVCTINQYVWHNYRWAFQY